MRLFELLIEPAGRVVAQGGSEHGLILVEINTNLLEDVTGHPQRLRTHPFVVRGRLSRLREGVTVVRAKK